MFVWSPSNAIIFTIVILIYWVDKLINTLLDPLEHYTWKTSLSTIKTNTLLFNSYYRRTDNMKVFASVLTLTAIMATTVFGCSNCNVWVLTILLHSSHYNCIIDYYIGLPRWSSLLLCCQPRYWWYWRMCWAQRPRLLRWRGILRYRYLRLNCIMELSSDNLLPSLRLPVETWSLWASCLSGIHPCKVKQKHEFGFLYSSIQVLV